MGILFQYEFDEIKFNPQKIAKSHGWKLKLSNCCSNSFSTIRQVNLFS